ncbi:MAG: phenylalanine--tRNA ligase subunit beta-related protein [Minisyncoccota bacterium]
MKISRAQLQEYFDTPLPNVNDLADAFTFHAFEIESVEGDLLDIKVLPNRAVDCATPEGVARELAAILNLPLKNALPPEYAGQPTVAVTVAQLNAILGAGFTREEVLDVFRRLQFRVEEVGEALHVTAPLPRTDIAIPEDVAEEVGQILGYDRVPSSELPPISGEPDQARFRGIEKIKDQLVALSFTEISTQSFAKKGDVVLANPLDKSKPALRTTLDDNMQTALEQAKRSAPLVLPPNQKPKLFEIGTVFTKDGEQLVVKTSEPVADLLEIKDEPDYMPVHHELGAYRPFSLYPFIVRDISMWITDSDEARGAVFELFARQSGGLLQQVQLLDQFTNKEGRQSLAFRLIFQSFERTLTDDEVNGIMANITAAITAHGYEVR